MVFQVHLSFRFPHQMPAPISLLSLACHMPRPSFLLGILNVWPTKSNRILAVVYWTGLFIRRAAVKVTVSPSHIRWSLCLQQCDCHPTASSKILYLGFLLKFIKTFQFCLNKIRQTQKKVFYMNTWVVLRDFFLRWTHRIFLNEERNKGEERVALKVTTETICRLL